MHLTRLATAVTVFFLIACGSGEDAPTVAEVASTDATPSEAEATPETEAPTEATPAATDAGTADDGKDAGTDAAQATCCEYAYGDCDGCKPPVSAVNSDGQCDQVSGDYTQIYGAPCETICCEIKETEGGTKKQTMLRQNCQMSPGWDSVKVVNEGQCKAGADRPAAKKSAGPTTLTRPPTTLSRPGTSASPTKRSGGSGGTTLSRPRR